MIFTTNSKAFVQSTLLPESFRFKRFSHNIRNAILYTMWDPFEDTNRGTRLALIIGFYMDRSPPRRPCSWAMPRALWWSV